VLIAVFGFVMAWARYLHNETWIKRLGDAFQGLRPTLEAKWYVDQFYRTAIVNPLRSSAEWLARVIDQKVIDGAVNGVGNLSNGLGEWARRTETGAIPAYALSILFGVAALVIYFVMRA
jgi:NADH-quinone oxidoreductase subunit L